jgi:hypothetical protein
MPIKHPRINFPQDWVSYELKHGMALPYVIGAENYITSNFTNQSFDYDAVINLEFCFRKACKVDSYSPHIIREKILEMESAYKQWREKYGESEVEES